MLSNAYAFLHKFCISLHSNTIKHLFLSISIRRQTIFLNFTKKSASNRRFQSGPRFCRITGIHVIVSIFKYIEWISLFLTVLLIDVICPVAITFLTHRNQIIVEFCDILCPDYCICLPLTPSQICLSMQAARITVCKLHNCVVLLCKYINFVCFEGILKILPFILIP